MGERQNRHIFVTKETDIHFNLATEKYLIENYDPDSTILFLWKNSPTVVIGRYQNPWEECRLSLMEKDSVALARRCSGGGAVYQDLGNICFTIICPAQEADKEKNFEKVLKALEMMGVKATLSGRNDVLVDGRKVSGSAFQTTQGRFCHHGTMLISTNLSKLPDYLTPNEHKLQSHGVKSVASRVANLTEFVPNATTDLFASCMAKAFDEQCPIEVISEEKLGLYPQLKQSFETFSSREWNLGKSPKFTNKLSGRFSGGVVSFYMTVEKGVITQVSIASDALSTQGVEMLPQYIIGLKYDAPVVEKRAIEVEKMDIKEVAFISGALRLLSSLIEES